MLIRYLHDHHENSRLSESNTREPADYSLLRVRPYNIDGDNRRFACRTGSSCAFAEMDFFSTVKAKGGGFTLRGARKPSPCAFLLTCSSPRIRARRKEEKSGINGIDSFSKPSGIMVSRDATGHSFAPETTGLVFPKWNRSQNGYKPASGRRKVASSTLRSAPTPISW